MSYQNGINEADERICDIVKNSQLQIESALSNQNTYWSNFTYNDTICLSRDFSYEVRFKNGNNLSSLLSAETQLGFYSNGKNTNITFSNTLAGQLKTSIKIADSVILQNQANLVFDFSQWKTVKLSFINDTFRLLVDGIEKQKIVYKHNICNLDIMKFSLPKDGSIDWIRVYDSRNVMVWQEEFESCTTFTPGIICDPFRLDKSITISRPCASDTLTLTANFPAMSYRWTNPLSQIDTNKNAKYINPLNGRYDLTANVNRCFTFTKNFDINISQQTVVNQEIKLCTGQTYKLPKGRIISDAGTYQDTLKTKAGCDSIIITKLSFNTIPITSLKASICNASNYTLPSGRIINIAGIYRDTTRNTEGCLQITEVTLSTETVVNTAVDINLCEGQTYTLPKGKIVNVSGVYKDTFPLSTGCDSIVTTNLKVNVNPTIKIDKLNSTDLTEGEIVILTTNSVNTQNPQYSWFETSTLISNASNVNINVKGNETQYKVVLKNSTGCTAEDSIIISALPKIEIPNAFTPNSDNVNDTFTIVNKSNNEKYYTIEGFNIFDRFGKQVYNNENGYKGWDGKQNGEDSMSDIYIYSIRLKSPQGKIFNYVGEVTLIR